MSDLKAVLDVLDADFDASVERLGELLKLRSISTDPEFAGECRKAADWLVRDLGTIGFSIRVCETEGLPMVLGHHPGPRPDSPHALFYGHYDVQPVDPLEAWDHAPFEPKLIEQGGVKVIAARGASDDKGQLMTFVEACRAYKRVHGQLPCRVTVLFEGEEESGSKSLEPFLRANADALRADFAMVCDTTMWDRETPAITVGLRGLLSEEIVVTGADRDLHSGVYGGAAANPVHVLARIIADLHDADGRVTIAGFYDGVDETPSQIKESWNMLGETPERFLGEIGLAVPAGEKGRSILELIWARPTAEVNGIIGGYTGSGFKTVIGSSASAKISFRLVHRQEPALIRSAFRQFVRDRLPSDCKVEFIEHAGSPAIQLSYDSPLLQKAKLALSDEWPKPAVMVAVGLSIPIVGQFKRLLGMDTLLAGFALNDDRIHAPNEKYDLESFRKGQRSWARILDAIGRR